MGKTLKDMIDLELDKILQESKINDDHRMIIDKVLNGASMKEAAGGKTKQLAQNIMNNLSRTMWGESRVGRKIVQSKISKHKNGGREVYIHLPTYSEKYGMIIASWFKQAGFRKRGDFVTTNESLIKAVSSKRSLYKIIKKEGYPLTVGVAELGEVSKIQMLVSLSNAETKKDEWIFSTNKNYILANKNNSFFPNFCHYQANKKVMLWSVYLLMQKHIPDFLKAHGLEDPVDFAAYVKTRRHDVKCVKFKKTKLSIGDSPVWEIDSIVDSPTGEDKIKKVLSEIIK